MIEKPITACLLVIGDEVLDGSRQDKHTQWFAEKLGEKGIWLNEVRIIPDDKIRIAETVRECSKKFTYVFTTGGLGPTHDDVTAESVAAAFTLPLIKDPGTDARLRERYSKLGKPYTKGRQKMAGFPQRAAIIPNKEGVGVAPGFRVENVYVFPGVPKEAQPMFERIQPELKGGPKVMSKSISILVGEGDFAEDLYTAQEKNPDVKIGSYPFKDTAGRTGATLKIRATDPAKLDAAHAALMKFITDREFGLVKEPSPEGPQKSPANRQ